MEKRILMAVNYFTFFFYLLLLATANFFYHSPSFYRNCMISIFLVSISLYTLLRTKEQKIINQFVTLVVCLSYLILLGSLHYAIAGITWTIIFLVYPILIFEFFGSFTFPNKDNLFLNFRWALILITIFTSISLTFESINPFIGFSSYLSSFLFCGIFYLKHAKIQTAKQKKYNRILIISFFISIAPIAISFLYHFIFLKNFDTSLITNYLLSFIIFPFIISFLLIKQYRLLLKPNFKLYTIIFIVSSIYILSFGSILYYAFNISIIQIFLISMLVIVGILLIYGIIDSFYKKDIINNNSSTHLANNKNELLFQFDDSNFLITINEMLSSYLLNTYNIDNYFFLWITEENSLTQLAGKTVDLHKLKKDVFLDTTNLLSVNQIDFHVFQLYKENTLLGALCIDNSQFLTIAERNKNGDFNSFIYHIAELLVAYFSLESLSRKNIELPKIKYPVYIAQNIDQHIEEINKNYSTYLHDDLLQSLLALNNFISLIKSSDHFKTLASETLNELINHLRSKIFEIYPTNINTLPLNENLEILKDNINAKYPDFNINFLYQTQLFFPDTLKLTLYRMISELITNAIKHSEGDCIDLSLQQTQKEIILEANDNGIGIDKTKIGDLDVNQKHFGILSIKEKVEQLEGKISFNNTELGLSVRISLPLSTN